MNTVVDTEDQLKMLLIEEGYCRDGEEDDYFDENYQGQFESLGKFSYNFLDEIGYFDALDETAKSTVEWFYENDDEDMLEAGEDYEAIVHIPFKMIGVENLQD